MCDELTSSTAEKYEMVLESDLEKLTLAVCPEDLIENADGQLDCPIEYVLRRNHLSMTDLNDLSPNRAIFIRHNGEESTIMHEIALDVNF